MSIRITSRVHPASGTGRLLVRPAGVLYVPAGGVDASSRRLLSDAERVDGRALLKLVAGAGARSAVAISWSDGGLDVVVEGTATVVTSLRGEPLGSSAGKPRYHGLGPVEGSVKLSCGEAASDDVTLRDGVVPAGGFVVALVGPAARRPALVLDDGRRVVLDGPLLLGRAPRALDPGRRTVAIVDETVSSSHLNLDVRDGVVWATDQGTTNGTHLLEPDDGREWQLDEGEPVPVPFGATVYVGQRWFRLEEA